MLNIVCISILTDIVLNSFKAAVVLFFEENLIESYKIIINQSLAVVAKWFCATHEFQFHISASPTGP